MQPRRWASFALLGLLGLSLSACTTAGVLGGPYPGQSRAPRTPRPVYDRPGPDRSPNDVRRTAEYRRIRQDAARYANLLKRELRLNNRQESAIQRLLIDRTEHLLQRTRPRDHRNVYPFPRNQRLPRAARSWWNTTDRQIERSLTERQRREYRTIARDLDRDGRYDRRRYERRDRDGDRHDNGRGRGHEGRGRGRGHNH